MSLKSTINLSFNANKNNQFILTSSSAHPRLAPGVAEAAGSLLNKAISQLENDRSALCAQAKKIEAILKPVLQGATPHYLMELKLDGRTLLGASNKPLQIELTEHCVKALSEHAAPSPSTSPIKPENGPKTHSILEILWELLVAFFAFFQTKPSEMTLSTKEEVTFIDGIRPLRNDGNDCFVNAIFQVIMHNKVLLDALLDTFKNDTSQQAQAFKNAVRAYQNDKTPISIKNLRYFIQSWHAQEDASELLGNIVNQMQPTNHPECYTNCTVINHWTLRDPSEASEQIPLNATTSIPSPEFFIPLQIPEAMAENDYLDGQQLIDEFQKQRPHQGHDWKRDEGGTYKPIGALTAIDQNAPRLVFQLKRFTKNGKIAISVAMPETLRVNGNGYKLKSIVVHSSPSKDSGHYYSLVHKDIGWVKCNDEDVAPIEDISSDLINGYIYFYERIS